MRKLSAFEKKCRQVEEVTGVELFMIYDEPKSNYCYEDDEVLHVCKGTERACFSVGADHISGAEQNERTRQVLTALGLEKKITDRVLVEEDEDEDEDEYCPHCGRSGW